MFHRRFDFVLKNDNRGIPILTGLIAQRAMMILACALGTIATIGAVCSTDAVNAVKARGDNGTLTDVSTLLNLFCSPLVKDGTW